MRGVILFCGWLVLALPASEAAAQGGMMHKGHVGGRMGDEARLPELLPEQLPDPKSEGAELTVRYCAQCHNLPSPATHSAKEWGEVMSRMTGYMSGGIHRRQMMHVRQPTAEESHTILVYLQQNTLRAFSGPSIPDPNSSGAKRYKMVCVRCHVLPDPRLHTAEEWATVVQRMRRNMKVMEKPAISNSEAAEITGYLQHHARPAAE
jgi:cytochrome c5